MCCKHSVWGVCSHHILGQQRLILGFCLQKLQGPENFGFVDQSRDPHLILNEWLNGEPKGETCTLPSHQYNPYGNQLFTESRTMNFPDSEAIETEKMEKCNIHRHENETEVIRLNRSRVTIHMKFHKNKATHEQLGKLIILPDSVEELLKIAGTLYLSSKILEDKPET